MPVWVLLMAEVLNTGAGEKREKDTSEKNNEKEG